MMNFTLRPVIMLMRTFRRIMWGISWLEPPVWQAMTRTATPGMEASVLNFCR